MLVNKHTTIARKQGFPEVIMPGRYCLKSFLTTITALVDRYVEEETILLCWYFFLGDVRNDMYVTILQGEFERGLRFCFLLVYGKILSWQY